MHMFGEFSPSVSELQWYDSRLAIAANQQPSLTIREKDYVAIVGHSSTIFHFPMGIVCSYTLCAGRNMR